MSIITLTMNPAIDVSMHIHQLISGPKLRGRNPTYEPGGGGINVSRVIHELGGRAQAIYTAGGPTGETLKNLLKKKHIDQRCIPINGSTRENIMVLEETSSRLYRLVMPGPEISEAEQSACIDILKTLDSCPAYMVISGSLPTGVSSDFYIRVIHELKACGTKIILDTKADTLKDVISEGVYLIKPNMRELSTLAGKDLDEEKQQEQHAHQLVSEGKAKIVVLSLGAAGVLVVSEEMKQRFRAPSVPIKSRVGAGDSTLGAITLALSQGRSLKEAVQYGIAAGSAAVMTSGTQLCRRSDVEHLFAQMS